MITPVLQMEGLSFSYRSPGAPIVSILNDTNLLVNAGQSMAITGESGVGKSTLLGLLSGVMDPDQGVISVDGMPLGRLTADQRCHLRARAMGLVFQDFQLIPYLTALENVAMSFEILGNKKPNSEQVSKAKSMLTQVGLENRLNHLPEKLSGGEKQRVAIARALVHEPKLILADEPTGNLDERTAKEVADLLFEQASLRKTALVIVTHSEAISKACAHIVQLEHGKLKAVRG